MYIGGGWGAGGRSADDEMDLWPIASQQHRSRAIRSDQLFLLLFLKQSRYERVRGAHIFLQQQFYEETPFRTLMEQSSPMKGGAH